jgi:hypothetical protein
MRGKSVFCFACVAFALVQTAGADWSIIAHIRQPFLSEHYDSLGQLSYDSLARYYPLKMTIFRGESESLLQTDTTDDFGSAAFIFGYWSDSTPVDTTTISRLALAVPNGYGASLATGQASYTPLIFDSLSALSPA